MNTHVNKLVIVGLGHVGSYVLADAVASGLYGEIALIDTADGVAIGEALDQHHATALNTRVNVDVHAGDYGDCADADVVIVAAGPSIIPSEENRVPDRAELAKTNAAVIRQVMGDIAAVTHDPVVIVITNPCDTMAHIAATEFGFPRGRVFGTGTMLDSARMRRLLADRHGIDPSSVHGLMLGEHGLSAVPALSLVSVAGVPNSGLGDAFGGDPYELDELAHDVVRAAYDVFNAKGWTNAGVAQSAIVMARAVLLDERAVYPATYPLDGEYGLDGVSVSLPCVIGRGGILRRVAPELADDEKALLMTSADAVRQAMTDAGALVM
ncbi:lactate/malate family dehydrogenase [Corynebacterium sp. TAE3-ERU16]|uniref:lactate/malate family dehydrogenase n=1 Tax=Corynebacterium sp. TAE3-ERU16 TaxID=2849493 RepID=UPI001C4619AC|nr:NAD(P)-binding domain-containing protein [Corynebacterium sp. TAE3-ERU16]MBV7293218.1 L-lactate dehydrogenase [Corynebacterium sp. TAE3-ERU16]